jgi:uncharacterized linocin/CFP29 family protein
MIMAITEVQPSVPGTAASANLPTRATNPETAIDRADDPDTDAQSSIHDQENKKVPWSDDVWKAIHRVVHEETMRVRVGAQFLPHNRVHPKTTSVAPDLIAPTNLPGDASNTFTLTIDEGATIRLNEIWAEFALTTQQVHETAEAKNPEHTSAVTLARRAAQYLALAQDLVIFNGFNGYSAPFFQQNIRFRQGQQPIDGGLLGLVSSGGSFSDFTGAPGGASNPFLSTNPVIEVPEVAGSPGTWGVGTFSGAVDAYSILTSVGQPGPYAFILHTIPYADLFAPIGDASLVITADRVAPLVKAGLYGTGALPPFATLPSSPSSSPPSSPPIYSASVPPPPYFGIMASVGGRTMDLVVGLHARTVFMQQDTNQNWRFRVLERFALRVTDPSAIVQFVFE